MGFGMELLFVVMLGLLVLGPKRMYSMLAHAARVKAEFENSARGLKSQLAAEFDAANRIGEADSPHEPVDK
ncbi:MAG: Sec-independent protein translocase family protein [Candidatus Sulfotelmatobacter sp.]